MVHVIYILMYVVDSGQTDTRSYQTGIIGGNSSPSERHNWLWILLITLKIKYLRIN
jgi:hypothetical protein